MGILAVDMLADIYLDDVFVSDSHIGTALARVSLRFASVDMCVCVLARSSSASFWREGQLACPNCLPTSPCLFLRPSYPPPPFPTRRAGVSLNHLVTERLADGVAFGSTISNSAIYGTTAASPSCTASTVCHAMAAGDVRGVACNSVMGPEWRRVVRCPPVRLLRAASHPLWLGGGSLWP